MANIPIYGKLVNETTEGIIADASQVAMPGGGTVASVKGLFVCTYGSTTYAQITAAVAAGLLPVCKYSGLLYVYQGDEEGMASNVHVFASIGTNAEFETPVDGDVMVHLMTCKQLLGGSSWSTSDEILPSVAGINSELSAKEDAIKRVNVTLAANAWSSSQQTVTVNGVKADETKQLIQPVPASASRSAYEAAGVKATAQAANALTFSCDSVPESDLTVYVIVTEVSA